MPTRPPTFRPLGARQATAARRRASDARRPTSTQRLYTYQWQQASQRYLKTHRVCVECKRVGRVTIATQVDHIIPHRGDRERFWDEGNWQPLCESHHSRKTRRGG